MKILFHENELNYRGQSTALYDYAHFSEEFLGHQAVIIYNKTLPTNHPAGIEKFKKRFEVLEYSDPNEIDGFIRKGNFDLFYNIKNGNIDGIDTKECRSAVHTVFKYYEPHGDVYAYVSEWLSQVMTGGKAPFVPHMVNIPLSTYENLRSELNIPQNAKVFGYYGGAASFNIKFAQEVVEKTARKYRDIFFIFMGVSPFVKKSWWRSLPKNIIFLPPSSDMLQKVKFINTCDALLHARERGETFGITVAEFALMGKPVITFAGAPEKAHIMELGEEAYYYTDKRRLQEILLDADLTKNAAHRFKKFLPETVMKKFNEVFLRYNQ